MAPQYPGHGKRVGRLIADMTPLKRVTVVDQDIDIRDPLHIDWALNALFDARRDTVIIDDVYFPLDMDPAVRGAQTLGAASSKMVLDATQKIDAGTFSLPPKEMMMRALDVWREAGLPEFQIPKRARLRLERS
jgi:3-polyprenyl-4-hydroxybenzoate decarboxylase